VRDGTLLLDITRSLNSTLELKEILTLVSEMVAVTLEVDQFAVMLLDEQGAALNVCAFVGVDDERASAFRLPLGVGASGLAATTRELVYGTDIQTDPRYVAAPHDPEDGSLLCVPMVCKEKLVGVLNFVRSAKDGFTVDDQMLLRLVGSQAAMAILNAQLFTETRELTLTDALTGVFNRRHLFARLELEIARAQRFGAPLSIAMIDIDHFKHLNDNQGHSTGDRVLREVASLLGRSVRKIDTVARYGGEEFVVVLPQTGASDAREAAEKLRRAVETADYPEGKGQPEGRLTISVGVATFPKDGVGLATLVDAADAALYASKRGGRNQVTAFASGMELHPDRERGPHAHKPTGS